MVERLEYFHGDEGYCLRAEEGGRYVLYKDYAKRQAEYNNSLAACGWRRQYWQRRAETAEAEVERLTKEVALLANTGIILEDENNALRSRIAALAVELETVKAELDEARKDHDWMREDRNKWQDATTIARNSLRAAEAQLAKREAGEAVAKEAWTLGRRSYCPAGVLADEARTEREWQAAKSALAIQPAAPQEAASAHQVEGFLDRKTGALLHIVPNEATNRYAPLYAHPAPTHEDGSGEPIDLSEMDAWFPDGVPMVAVKIMFPERSMPLSIAEVRHVMAALALSHTSGEVTEAARAVIEAFRFANMKSEQLRAYHALEAALRGEAS